MLPTSNLSFGRCKALEAAEIELTIHSIVTVAASDWERPSPL